MEGNLHARRRIEFIQMKLEEIGLESGRVKMINVSAAMGGQFALDASEMTEEIRKLGQTG
ncbi:MAG: hypothetical protein DRI65_12295 [Chloroflexota bacterium]|nr:MAG: hypothetical protein DRI65_12295 [Chloroflexota bacterium]HDD62340.1 hydrogenase iron-sulfur subunit [Chloroflexota bacterium]